MRFSIYNHKIKTNPQYKYVYSSKNKIYHENFTIYYRNNNQTQPFFGISISCKIGNSVVRHKIKRWFFESLKIHGNDFFFHYNYVFVVKNIKDLTDFHIFCIKIKSIIDIIKKNTKLK
jgi:ribonuclease P protein component